MKQQTLDKIAKMSKQELLKFYRALYMSETEHKREFGIAVKKRMAVLMDIIVHEGAMVVMAEGDK